MPGTEHSRCAIAVIAFALQFVAVQAHLLGDHHGHQHAPPREHGAHSGATHLHGADDHGHGHDHRNSQHSAQDHALTQIGATPKQVRAERDPGSPWNAPTRFLVACLLPDVRVGVLAPTAPRATAPPRGRRARAPPMA